ncbi:hypothetical protein [Paenibacillus graminis]|uniref:Uncharacterized protein n=1 Tax=Paenibacillus graminis TaxID=189425 RepID=A0A089M2W5_9BACL|nr:hypothetical protein [Paenibacillus graminis]AIQ67522.1 hypothetical protein PGRAT_07655 [Paenibacillus graminis]
MEVELVDGVGAEAELELLSGGCLPPVTVFSAVKSSDIGMKIDLYNLNLKIHKKGRSAEGKY